MAKISVLIPTYNRPHFLRQALESVLKQTRLPDEVIIGDDNTENYDNYKAVEDLLKKYPFITYIKNKKRLGAAGNYKNLFNLASGDYIKWLADDDILLPEALEIQSYYLDKYPDVKLITSSRLPVDENLNIIKAKIPSLKKPYKKTTIAEGKALAKKTLIELKNYIGEFSAVLFRKKDINFELFKLRNLEFRANSDWLTWLFLLHKGKGVYISKPLIYFRITETQDQLNPEIHLIGQKELFEFVFGEEINSMFSLTKREKLKQISIYTKNLVSAINFFEIKNELNKKKEILNILQETLKRREKFINNKRKPVSIITVTYNSEKTLIPFLESVKKTMEPEDELIIVDNASKDRTREILEKYRSNNIKVIFSPENLGFTKGSNLGIKNSKNPYIILLNPDTVVFGDWINNLTKHFSNNKIGAVGPITTYSIPLQHISSYYNTYLLSDFSYEEKYNLIKCIGNGRYRYTKILVGFCMALRRDILEKVGYLDEDLFLGNDDLEISWRLRENGYKLKIAADTFIYHEGQVSFKTEKKSKTEKLVQESTNKLADKLINYYGYGNVPHPSELWGIDWFIPKGEKYRYMFKIGGKKPLLDDINTKDTKVSVVLVNYKNPEDTAECVLSLIGQDHSSISIIVIDNSEDQLQTKKLADALKIRGVNPEIKKEKDREKLQFKKDVLIIEAEENKGFSYGNNIGIKIGKENGSDYIWILNNDTVVQKDTLSHMLEVSVRYDSPAVTCKIKDYHQKDKVQYAGETPRYDLMEDREDIIKKPIFLTGANILIRSDVFETTGLFDEDFFLYFEDNLFFKKLIDKKIRVLYTPFTHIYHKGGSSTGEFLKNPFTVYYAVRNALLLTKKLRIKDYSMPAKLIKDVYTGNYASKKTLKALILGIYDFYKGEKGRKKDLEKLLDQKKLVKKEGNTEDIEEIFRLSFSYPRKREYINLLLNKISEEKGIPDLKNIFQ